MSKNTISSITLALAAILIIGGLVTMTDPEFGTSVVGSAVGLGLGVALAVITWRLRVSVKKEEDAAARDYAQRVERYRQEAMAEARQAREEKERQEKERRERFRHERYAVAGVTFKNEDGTDRQKILREIALNDDGLCGATIEELEDEGKDAGIRVMTEYGCVGFIRRSDKETVRRFFDHEVNTMVLSVELFVNDDGQKIYRADLVIGMDRTQPGQAWYFDALQKQ